MTKVDWIALGVVALAALSGLRRGLVASAFSLAGVVAGAVVGARIGPHFLSHGAHSPYNPLAALAGAVLLAGLLKGIGSMLGSMARGSLSVLPPLRALDSAGGLLVGGAFGFAIVWVLGAVALQLPGQTELRRGVQQSVVLQRLNELVPPRTILKALARVDPFPSISSPLTPVLPPDPAVLRRPEVRRAGRSVLRVTATACGLGVEGSGWVARPGLVVTAAHVIAGGRGIRVGDASAYAVAVDRHEDVAVLRVPGLRARPLPLVDAAPGVAVAILGYPENGPFDARAGRMGPLVHVRGRTAATISGVVRHGNSGGPAVDANGAVETTVFAAAEGRAVGLGVTTGAVRSVLRRAGGRVSTGPC